jgi:hypothetical protein
VKNSPLLFLGTGLVLLLLAATLAYRGTRPVLTPGTDSTELAEAPAALSLRQDTLLTWGSTAFALRTTAAGTVALRDSGQAALLLRSLNADLPQLAACFPSAEGRLSTADLTSTRWDATRLGRLLDLDAARVTSPAFRQLRFGDAVLTALVSRLRSEQTLYPTGGLLTDVAPFVEDEALPAPAATPPTDWTLPGILFALGLLSLMAGILPLLRRRATSTAPIPVPAAPRPAPVATTPAPPVLDKTRLHEQVLLALVRQYAAGASGTDGVPEGWVQGELARLIPPDQNPLSTDEQQRLQREAEALLASLKPQYEYARRLYETLYLTPEGRDILTEWDKTGQPADVAEHLLKTSTHARSFLKFYLGRTTAPEDDLNRRLLLEGGRVAQYGAAFRTEEFRDDSRLMPPSIRLLHQLAQQHGVRDLDNVVFRNLVYIPRQALTPTA